MESQAHASALHNFISQAEQPVELLPLLLQCIDIESLATFVHDQVDMMHAGKLRTTFYSVLPINESLQIDVMQRILSFGDENEQIENRVVCQEWNRLYQLNEVIKIRAVYQRINDKYGELLSPSNDTWIWNEACPGLHPVELHLGYRGPLQSARDVGRSCKSGDRVLVHKRDWEDQEFSGRYGPHYYWRKNIHFIGVCPDVTKCRVSLRNVTLYGRLTMDNLTVRIHEFGIGTEHSWNVSGQKTLIATNCEFWYQGIEWYTDPIAVWQNGNLTLRNCTLRNDRSGPYDRSADHALRVSPWAKKVDIHNNTILGFEEGIVITNTYTSIPQKPELARINITNNFFQSSKKKFIAVVERMRIYSENENLNSKIHGTNQCILHGNKSSQKLAKPNTLLLREE